MKKLAIGCLGVLLLLGLVAAGVAYYTYRQLRSTIVQLAELGQVADIERSLRVQGGFTPPVSEELTREQLERLLRVQALVVQRLGERVADFEKRYKALSAKENATIADAPAILAAYRDMAAAWLEAKRSQVEALNEVGLSLEEYRWVRDQAYRALGMPYVDFDIGRLVEDVRRGAKQTEVGRLRGAMGPAGPDANRKLVEAFKKQLEQNIALVSFGL
jgi:hypothetical protein